MIFGTCPYCNASLTLSLPDIRLPAFAPHDCEECGQKIWTKFARFDPTSWTEEAFLEEYDVDENTNTITKKVMN